MIRLQIPRPHAALVDDFTHACFYGASELLDEFRIVGLPAFEFPDDFQRQLASVRPRWRS